MSSAIEDFDAWYVKPLQVLYCMPRAGFPILLITFPLLERYLRHLVGLGRDDNLNDKFYSALAQVVPEFGGKDVAQNFWSAYRNGLLHEASLARQTRKGTHLPVVWLSDQVPIFSIGSNGDYWLHPRPFSERVVAVILSNFGVFEAGTPSLSRFPSVVQTEFCTATGCAPGPRIISGTNVQES